MIDAKEFLSLMYTKGVEPMPVGRGVNGIRVPLHDDGTFTTLLVGRNTARYLSRDKLPPDVLTNLMLVYQRPPMFNPFDLFGLAKEGFKIQIMIAPLAEGIEGIGWRLIDGVYVIVMSMEDYLKVKT